MIVAPNFLADLLIHFVLLLLLSMYVRYTVRDGPLTLIIGAFLAAGLITYLNHKYFPRLIVCGLFDQLFEGFAAVPERHLCAVDALCRRRAACPYGESYLLEKN